MRRLVIIPFNVPWAWSTDYLNQTAFELSRRGNIVVCFLWGELKFLKEILLSRKFPSLISKYSENIYLVNPVFLMPFGGIGFVHSLNLSFNILFLEIFAWIIGLLRGCKEKIFWIFDPNMIFIFKKLRFRHFLLYDCVDFFAVGSKKNIHLTNRNEKYICGKADLVVANSHVLQDHLKKYRKDVYIVPQGFRSGEFTINENNFLDLKLKKPVIGFVGGINSRLDLSILYPLIKNNEKWNFVLWGPIQERDKIAKHYWNLLQKIMSFPNVTSGKSLKKSEIPGIISQFSVGMIPYDISQDFNKFCYPMKLFEYFYLGKPVISTEIMELTRFSDLVKIAKYTSEWEKSIKNIIGKKWPKENILKQRKLALDNSWKNKVNAIVNEISKAWPAKSVGIRN